MIKYKMIDYDYEMWGMIEDEELDKKKKRGKLKPAIQRHHQKQAKVWQTKTPRKESK